MSRGRCVYPLFVIIAAIMLFTGSCSAGTDNGAVSASDINDAGDGTVLRFISSWGGVDSKAETLKAVLDRFEKDNPDIKVENESLFGEDFLPRIENRGTDGSHSKGRQGASLSEGKGGGIRETEGPVQAEYTGAS